MDSPGGDRRRLSPYPGRSLEDAGPSRRERRRAKTTRTPHGTGRRLITFRTLLFVILLAAVLVGAFFAVRWYDTNSYFVRTDGNELVIYQGRIGGVLWYHPVVVDRTRVTTADVPSSYIASPREPVCEETSVANARAYVRNLVAYKRSADCPLYPDRSAHTRPPRRKSTPQPCIHRAPPRPRGGF